MVIWLTLCIDKHQHSLCTLHQTPSCGNQSPSNICTLLSQREESVQEDVPLPPHNLRGSTTCRRVRERMALHQDSMETCAGSLHSLSALLTHRKWWSSFTPMLRPMLFCYQVEFLVISVRMCSCCDPVQQSIRCGSTLAASCITSGPLTIKWHTQRFAPYGSAFFSRSW